MQNMSLSVLYLCKIFILLFFVLKFFGVFKKNLTLQHSYSYYNSFFADGEREQAWRADDVPGGEDAPPLHARPQSRNWQHGTNDWKSN